MNKLITAFAISFSLFTLCAQDQNPVEPTKEVVENGEITFGGEEPSNPQDNTTTTTSDCGCGGTKKK